MTGQVSPPAVTAALERAVQLGERSVQVAAYRGGELIVDAWIGDIDRTSVFSIFSVSKAVTALAIHLQAERGLLDPEAPVARYWPEYGSNGKERVTIRDVLSHRAGVPQMPDDVTPERLGDWAWMTRRLTEIEPLFEPGTTNAYHSMSFGWLLGEVVRRTDPQHRPFDRFVAEELCEPLGAASLWFGVPDRVEPRVADLGFPFPPPPPSPDAIVNLAVPPPVRLMPEVFNRPDVRAACIPAVGAIADARSVARVFSLLATGGRIDGRTMLSEERVRSCLEPRPDFDLEDAVYERQVPSGVGGLWIEAPGLANHGRRDLLCHPSVGGTIAWAELDARLAVAICHDRMFVPTGENPFAAIADAIRDVAGRPSK